MLNEFKNIPEPLQKKILTHTGLGLVSILLSIFLFITLKDFHTGLPGILMFIFFIISAFVLFKKAVTNEYMVIRGQCSEIHVTAIKRHTKAIIINAEGKSIKILMKQRLKKFRQGMMIDVYVDENAPLYETGDGYILQTYLAIDAK
jgi:membrane-bound ClpP family serine protease